MQSLCKIDIINEFGIEWAPQQTIITVTTNIATWRIQIYGSKVNPKIISPHLQLYFLRAPFYSWKNNQISNLHSKCSLLPTKQKYLKQESWGNVKNIFFLNLNFWTISNDLKGRHHRSYRLFWVISFDCITCKWYDMIWYITTDTKFEIITRKKCQEFYFRIRTVLA